MFGKLKQAVALLEEFVRDLDPEVLAPDYALELVETFSKAERLSSAGKALAAGRVADSGVWKKGGDRSAAHWLAKKNGTSVGQAVSTIETARRVSELPETERAIKAGELSEVQAKEVVHAASLNPSKEKELLEVAKTEGVATLRERCAKVVATSTDDEVSRYNRIHQSRQLRHYCDAAGAFNLHARLTPDAGAIVIAALEPYKDEIFKQARAQGRRESYEAYAADALVEVAKHVRACDKRPSKSGPGTLVKVLVDHKAINRGSVGKDEVCEIEGVGPIPVATAKAMAKDAIIAALVTDGTDIYNVSHIGKSVTARQRTALEVRDRVCVVPGCEVKDHLEIDHITGREGEGAKTIANIARLCSWHHYLKTHKDWRLTGGPGDWKFDPPGGKGGAGPDP
ncbi:MAG: HNH endonuclease [Actinobacteria bacterium]|nr:HNH endonuclease [Actinomycetota bacterium]